MPQMTVFGMAGAKGVLSPALGRGRAHPLWLEQQEEHDGDRDEQQDRDDRGLATTGLPGLSRSRALDRRLISGRERCHGDHPAARVERGPPASVL